MGWWSKDIMGGDTPLDWEDEFYGICEVEKWPEGKRGGGFGKKLSFCNKPRNVFQPRGLVLYLLSKTRHHVN